MPLLKQPQGWRYLKARLRLLNRPQAVGTIAVLLVSGGVLMNYWRRQPAPPTAPTRIPAASTPAPTPTAPLATLEPPSVSQPSPTPDSPVRSEAIAAPTTPAPLLVLPTPSLLNESAPGRSIDRPPSSLPNLENFAPASPTAPLADPLRQAIASPTPAQIAPSIAPSIAPNIAPNIAPPVRPYATSPPPGTTGYILPPTLTPSPNLPAAPIAPVPQGMPSQ
ncbi:MAG: hypothetical protein HC895_24865, partial [Leptolyngbyaceae cyanobacterium SM1_3_5]|nr:hypothetical protein [Leptolyngbyaceae cyanobacterium SM1_3_5]